MIRRQDKLGASLEVRRDDDIMGGCRCHMSSHQTHNHPLRPVNIAQGLPQGVPIFVATTNDALQAVVAGTPPARRADLVFLQNGMLLPTLSELGLAGNTQALLYMSCSSDGAVVDGGGRSVATGRWAGVLCGALRAGGVGCAELPPESYLPRMVEKLLWASTFWLLCEALGGATVSARPAPRQAARRRRHTQLARQGHAI
jgi:hypothetical protein